MKKLPLAAAVLALALPAFAQAPEPEVPPAKPRSSMKNKFFVGGGVGLAFGTVDYLEIAPLLGFRVAPRVDLGLQPFYRWINDGRYSPSLETTDYGARLFARVRIVARFFAEADYQFTSYEYANGTGGSTRSTNNAFLAGVGYTMPFSNNAGMYFSVLYDFTYKGDQANFYNSPIQFQIGASVGF